MANDILKKYVKQSQKKMKPLAQKSGSWVMNVLKSAGYTGMDVITELAPSTMETAKATATIGKDVATTLKGARTSDRSLKNALDKSFYVGLGKRFLQNSLEDLKTGKFYNKERKDALFNNGDDDFDLDFDFGDEDFDSNFDDFSDTVESSDGETVASFKRKKGKNVEITNIDVNTDMGPDSTIVQATEFQTETMINVGQAMVDESRTENRAMMTMLGTIRNEVGTSLASMADNVSQITSVVSEHLSQHITLSSKFFEDSLSIQQQILDQLKANAEGKAGTGINTREFKEYQDIMDLFETGGEGFDFKSYGDIVKRQFGNYVNNNMLLSAIKMMDSNREVLEQWVASPWESTLKAVFNKAIPEIVQKSVSAFDEQLKETGVALFNQINGLQRSNNPILSGLGQIFGLQNKITLSKIDKSAYNKGEMAWTGIDHQALTNVIPTFLRKIYAAVSGKQEVAFDFQNGVWKNLADIEKGFADDKVRRETSGFSDYKSEFTDFLNTFAIGSNEKEEYKEAFNKFIGKLVTDSKGGRTFRLGGRSGNETDGFGKRDDIRELLGAASSDDMNVKMIRAYLQSLEETNKAQLTRFFGSAVQEQRATIDTQMREMQQDPVRFNTMYMDTGLTRENGTNSHLKFEDKNDKRKVTGVKTTAGGVGSMVDEYKNTTNYYLREILKTLNTGIYVLPVTELAGVSASTNPDTNPDGSPKTEKQKEKERRKALRDEYRRMEATGLQGQQLRDAVRENVEIRDGNNAAFNDIRIRRNEVTAKLKDQRTKRSKERSAYERRDNYNEEKRQKDIQRGMTALDTEMTQEQITTAYAEHRANRTEENVEEKTIFDKLIDMLPETSGARKLVDNFNKKRSEVGSAIESKVNVATTALFDLVFGDADGKRGMDKLFQRVMAFARTQFTKFGKFLDDKVLTPLNDALFGDDGLVSKIKQTEFGKKMSEIFGKLTGNLSSFVFGEMGPDGKRINGLFSSTLNALKDIGTYVKDGILGMKGPDGKPLPLDQDNSVLGNLKRMTRSISNNIKDALGVGEAPNRLPLSTRIADTIDAMFTRVKERSSDWTNAIFGDENLNISSSTKFFMDSFSQDFKQDMKENKGFIAATSSLGLLSSFFLPGGPIGGALIGAGVGIITKSRGLKDILFGPEDKYGDRVGGIITKGTQDFFKEHKMAMIGGAGLGLASSIGLLPSFFLPGGPIGGALIGTSVSLIAKSGAFNELLYGKGGTKDDPTGGLKKKFNEVFGKAKDSKGIAIDAGIGAGVGIVGSFFLPGGPILGALIGSAISVGTATDKFRTWMFGPEGEDGKRAGGMFGKVKGTMEDFLFGKAGNDGVRHNGLISRLTTTAKLAQDKISEFIQVNMVTPVKYAMAPILAEAKDIKDAIKSKVTKLFTAVKDKITSVVIKPVGDGIKKHFLDPMKNLFLKLFKGFGKTLGLIISAPFKAVGLTGDALNFKHRLQGKDSYDPELRAKRKQEIADIRAEHARKREAIKAGTDENTQRRRSIFDWRRKDRAKDDQTRLDDDMYDVLQEANGIETDNLRILNPKDKSNNTKVKATPEYEGPSGLDVLAEAQGRPTSKEANGKTNTEKDASADNTQNTTVATTPTANTDVEEPSGLDILAEANGIIGGEESDNTRVSTTESSDEETRTVSRKKDRKAKRQKKKENKRKKEERRRGVTDDTRIDVPSNEPTSQIPTTEEEPSGLDILAQANNTEDTRVNTTTPETEVVTVANARNQERPQNTEVSTNVSNAEENVTTPTVETPNVPNNVVREIIQGTNVSDTRVETNVITPETPTTPDIMPQSTTPTTNVSDTRVENAAIESEINNTSQERVTGTPTTVSVPSNTNPSVSNETNESVNPTRNAETRLDTRVDTGEDTTPESTLSAKKSNKDKGSVKSIQSDVSKISDSVYGQLNGVGRNVYKIYKLLLKKFNESDENIDGENNKEYVGFFGKIKTALNNPIKFVKNAITAPFRKIGEAVTGIVGKIKGFGKKLFDAGKSIVTGVFNFGKDLIGGMFDFGKNLVTGLADSAKFLVENIGKGLAAIGGVAVDVIHTGLSAVREAVPIIGDVVRTGVDVLGDGLRAASSALVTGVNIIGDGLSAASSLLITGVETVGNVISGAATGIGELLGGAMSGLGSMLSAVGLISVEAVKGVIGAGKFVAGGLAKGIKGAGSAVFGAVKRVVSPKIYHVVVDGGSIDIVKYVGTVGGTVPEDLLSNVSNDTLDDTTRVSEESMTDENSETPRNTIFETIDRLNSVISSFIDRIKGGSGEDTTGIDSEDTRLSVPSNETSTDMEPATDTESEEVSGEDEEAPKGKFGNFMSKFISDENKTKLSNKVKTAKATVGGVFSNAANSVREKLKRKDEQERAEQADRGSRSSVEAKIAEEDKTEQEATFREKMLSLLGRGADASETHSSSFLKVFDIKKGLITAGLIALAPFVFNLFKKFNIGEILTNLLSSISDGFKEVGGLIGMINRTKDQKEQVEDAMNGTDTHYQLDENGNLVYDEDGNIKKETTMSSHIVEAVTPTVTRTNLETGEFENKKVWTQKSGAIAKKGTQIALTGAGTAIRVGETVGGAVSKVASTTKSLGNSIINNKRFIKVADRAVQTGSNILKPSAVNGVATTTATVGKAAESVVRNTGDDVAEAVTKTGVAKKIGTGVKTAATAVKNAAKNKAAKNDGIISKALNFMLESADKLIAKLAELGPRFKIKLPVSKFSSVLEVLKKALKPANLQKFTSKISNFIKVLTAKHSLGPISLTLMDAGFMLYGAVEGASNAAGVFEVDSSEVDGKMRAIAAIFKAFLGTSIGGWLDLAASICYEITGVNWIKEIATAAYNIISNDEDDAALKAAQDKFTEDYEAHVDEAYEAYAKHAEETGKEVMSKEEYIQEGLAPSRSEYNSERNKSLFKKGVDAVGGLFKKKDKNKTAVNTTVPKSYADYSKEVTSKGGTPMSEEEYNTSVEKQSKKKGFFANAKDKVETKLLGMADAQDKFVANAKDKVETTLLNIANFEDELMKNISGKFSSIFGKIGGFIGGVIEDGKTAVGGIGKGIAKIIATYNDTSKGFLDYFKEDINVVDKDNAFYDLTNTVLNISRIVMLPKMIVFGIFKKLTTGAANILKSVVGKAKSIFKDITLNNAVVYKYAFSGDVESVNSMKATVDENNPIGGITSFILETNKFVAQPIAVAVSTFKGLGAFVKKIFGKAKSVVKDIAVNHALVTKLALTGDMKGLNSMEAVVDENNPMGGITSAIMGIDRFFAQPIAIGVATGKAMFSFVKKIFGKAKSAVKDLTMNHALVTKLALTGNVEGLSSMEAVVDENNPIGGITSAILGLEKFVAQPIAIGVATGKSIFNTVKGVITKSVSTGKTVIDTSKSLVKYAIAGDLANFNAVPDIEDDSSPITHIANSVIGSERFALSFIAIPVATGKAMFNMIKDKFNKTVDYAKQAKSFVTKLNTYTDPKKSLSGWDAETMATDDEDVVGGLLTTIIKKIMWTYVGLIRTVKNVFGWIGDTASDAVNTVKDGLDEAATNVKNFASNAAEGIANAFDGIGTFLMDLGRGGKDGGRPIYGKGETANGYPYYSQNDPKYKNKQYKQTGGRGETAPDTMGDSGCGPTAMAMVASKITGKEYDPMTMAKMSEAGGYSTSLGTSPEYFTSAANTLGINSSLSDPTSENLQASLAGGNSVILQGVKSANNNSPFTSEGHYVTVVGLDKDNVIVNDPRGKEYSGQYKMKDVIGDTTGMWSFSGGGRGGVRNKISSKIKKKLRRGGKGTDDWLNVVKTVKAKVAEQHPTYHNPNPVSITINAYGKDLRVRCDCSGLVSAYLVVYGVAPEGTSLTSGAFADPNNATMKSTGFQSAAWSGWENLQPGDIIARNGHVEVFARNDGSSHKVYNGGSTDSLGNPGETYTGHKEGYTTIWRCGNVSGLATTSGTDAYTASMADNGSYSSSGSSSSSESGGVSSFSELLAGAASAFASPFLEAFGFKTSAAESSGSTGSMSGDASSGGFVTAANLSGSENAEKAFNFLVDRNYTPAGAAGLLGNLYAESHILPNNLQDSGNRSTGMSDDQYTSAVDNGSYSRFSKDSIGYGLAQWTSGGRKENLLNFAKQHGTSIGDLGMQLSFLDQEMQSGYKPVYNTLTTTSDLKAASDIVLHKFEAPADQSAAVENTRASYGQAYYNQYANKPRSTGSTSVSGPVGSSQYIPGTSILKPGYSSTTTTSGPTGSSQYIPGTSILKPGGNGGNGSGKPVKPASGGMGSTGGYDKVYQAPGTISNPTQNISKIIDNIGTSGSMSTADMKKMVVTIIEYLSNIVDNTGSTSEGIDKLNSKDFGSTNNMTNNFVSDNSSTVMNADTTTGRTVDKSSDRSNYSMAKRVAAGILT